jgi:hypothetical protein
VTESVTGPAPSQSARFVRPACEPFGVATPECQITWESSQLGLEPLRIAGSGRQSEFHERDVRRLDGLSNDQPDRR